MGLLCITTELYSVQLAVMVGVEGWGGLGGRGIDVSDLAHGRTDIKTSQGENRLSVTPPIAPIACQPARLRLGVPPPSMPCDYW